MLDLSKIVARLDPEASPDVEMKAKEQHETLDNLIKQTLTNDSFLSFSKAEKNPVQWFHLLDTLDQQSMNQDLSSSKLELALEGKGSLEEIKNDSKTEESPVSKNCSAKGGNLFGRGLQSAGDKFSALRLPEAMAAIAQAAKDIPGWPLRSSKVTMHKCEKCFQEFSSPLNQRRHMRATHRRPLKGDKEDLKNKTEQVGIFWDKLTVEGSREILLAKNLSLGDLSAASLVRALSNHLQQPGLVSLPQSYIKIATSLLDIVHGKPSSYPLSSRELFTILVDASEDNFFHGVTSSSMQRCIFGSKPGRVGLETKNLVSSLGFLVELRLVQAWMDHKDAEALRCQNALVEEEEAAQKKRAKLQERKQQKKLRQRESKDKDMRALESSVSVQELSLDFLCRKEEDSPTISTPSSGFSGADTSPKGISATALVDTRGANHNDYSSSFIENEQIGFLDYKEEFESQNTLLDQKWDSARTFTLRLTNEYDLAGGRSWKERRNGDHAHSLSHLKYGVSHDRKGLERQVGDHWPRKSHFTSESSAQELLKTSTFKFREKFSVMKRPNSVTGNGYAVWTKKALQTSGASLHRDNVGTTVIEIVNDALGTAAGKLEESTGPSNPGKPAEGQSQGSSFSRDSIVLQSTSSMSTRKGLEDHEDLEGMSSTSETIVGRKIGINTLVIGSVTIPYGDTKLISEFEEVCQPDEGEVKCDETSPKGSAVAFADAAQQLTKSALISTVREMPVSWKDAPPYQPLSELCNKQFKAPVPTLVNKPSIFKVWRPIPEHDDTFMDLKTGIVLAEKLDQGVTVAPMVGREVGSEYVQSCVPMQSQPGTLGSDKELIASPCTQLEDHEEQAPPPVQAAALRVDLASLLYQRWDDAISSADAVYHQDWDE